VRAARNGGRPTKVILSHQLATRVALSLRKEVVVPLPVGVGFQIGKLAGFADDADEYVPTRAAVNRLVGFRVALDALNRNLAADLPPVRCVPDVRDVLVAALGMGLGDAIDFVLFHNKSPRNVERGLPNAGAVANVVGATT
jgi:hypothetical protein